MPARQVSLDGRIQVELADTPQARRQGLGGRRYLVPGHGMLYVFPDSVQAEFTEADTQFALTTAFLADRELGLRHRAAIGITEEGDAIAVVVSEERGAISITHNGRIIRDIDVKRLESILRAFLIIRTSKPTSFRERLRNLRPKK